MNEVAAERGKHKDKTKSSTKPNKNNRQEIETYKNRHNKKVKNRI